MGEVKSKYKQKIIETYSWIGTKGISTVEKILYQREYLGSCLGFILRKNSAELILTIFFIRRLVKSSSGEVH
jgi:hypothetical protein